MRRVPSHCKHKHSGKGVVRLNGTDFYTGVHGTPAAERRYDQLISEWLAARSAGIPFAASENPTVSELVAAYVAHVKIQYTRNGKPTAQQRRIRIAVSVTASVCPDKESKSFGPLSLEAVRQVMIGKGWSKNFINHSVNAIRQMFRWAAKRELLPEAVYQQLRSLEQLKDTSPGVSASRKIMPVDLKTVRRTLAGTLPVVRHLCYLQYLAGMRAGEAADMRPCDINLDGMDPHGFRHPGVWVYSPPEHKTAYTGGTRIVFIGRRGQAILRPYLDREPTAYCFSPREAVLAWLAAAGRKMIIRKSRQPGEKYATSALDVAIRKAAKRAGVPHWSPHQLRHTRATEIRSKYGPDAARVVLGHSLPGVTGVYAEADLRMAAKVMREIG